MKKSTKASTRPKKSEGRQIGMFDLFSEMFSGGKLKLPGAVVHYLKVLGFLTIWFSIPLFILIVWFIPRPVPEIFEAEVSPSPSSSGEEACTIGGGTWGTLVNNCTNICHPLADCLPDDRPSCDCGEGKCWDSQNQNCNIVEALISPSPSASVSPSPSPSPSPDLTQPRDINFKIRLKGVVSRGVANQPLRVELANSDSTWNKKFNPVSIWQDGSDTGLFHGKLALTLGHLRGGYTIFVKGPLHLQRKFTNITLSEGQELDLTSKSLLPGDLPLPQSGQDDRVDNSDRDYLWSMVVLDSRQPTSNEVSITDLDRNRIVDGRDYSLLIDTGIGVEGER